MTYSLRLAAGLLSIAAAANAQRPIPVIVDTDIGDAIDDVLALALALNSPELDVRAVTTVVDDVESKTRLAWKELGIYGRHDIPLAMGAAEPLLDPTHIAHPKEFEVLTRNDALPEAARKRAATLIIETLLAAPGKVTLLPIGPLTNIALALKTEPSIKTKIERIVLMGGAFQTQEAEYNIKRDRAAAAIVFGSGVPITAVGLDVTASCKLREDDLNRLRAAAGPGAQFLLRLITLAQAETGETYPTLYDPLAVAVAFRRDLIETQDGTVEVPLTGPAADGRTIFRAAPASNVKVGVKVNAPAFLDLFIQRVAK